jgi:hypothetical protein
MIVFLYILASTISFIPLVLYTVTHNNDVKWYSKIFCENSVIFLFALIIFVLTRHKRYIVRKFSTLGLQFWIIKLFFSQIDCFFAYKSINEIKVFGKTMLVQDIMICLPSLLIICVMIRAVYILYKYYKKLRYQNENRGTV